MLRRETKTEASDAPLPLPDICVAALKLRREQVWYSLPGSGLRSSRATSIAVSTTGINQAGVRRINVHSTRKTCGTLLAALDVHPRVAMHILRHSRISVTMEIYTEATSAATRDALKRLGDELGSPVNPGQAAEPAGEGSGSSGDMDDDQDRAGEDLSRPETGSGVC